MKLRIGTRGSQLALWQANESARLLGAHGHEIELVKVRTTGDKRPDVTLASIGGKGVFIKELEEALQRNEIDLAVHSLKDVPSMMPSLFVLAGYLEREDPRDAWVHPAHLSIDALEADARVGTSSPRRRAQLCERFPSLRVDEIRGNVDSRIAKAHAGAFAGIVLAAAGLIRLGREAEITTRFSLDEMLPAAGQGIVVLECLRGNAAVRDAIAAINHEPSALAARCERGVLQRFGTRLDCYSAIAVHAEISLLPSARGEGARSADEESAIVRTPHPARRDSQGQQLITIRAFVSDNDATRAIRVQRSARNADDAIAAVHEALVADGAEELLWAR